MTTGSCSRSTPRRGSSRCAPRPSRTPTGTERFAKLPLPELARAEPPVSPSQVGRQNRTNRRQEYEGVAFDGPGRRAGRAAATAPGITWASRLDNLHLPTDHAAFAHRAQGRHL
eukprot:328396-Prymnesium_polylepis.1